MSNPSHMKRGNFESRRAWDRVFDGAWTLLSGLVGILLGAGLDEARC